MATIRDRILDYLIQHPEGVDDDELAQALRLKQRQQANGRCRQLASEGVVERREVHGKIHNFCIGGTPSATLGSSTGGRSPRSSPVVVASLAQPDETWSGATRSHEQAPNKPWFWEGHIQDVVVARLRERGFTILQAANTSTRETGKDIIAQSATGYLWVTVKGYPEGTPRTQPSTQAGHWFKQALFDIVAWRGEDEDADLALALPDFRRYRRLAEKVGWLQPTARFALFWVREDRSICVVRPAAIEEEWLPTGAQ